MEELRINLQPPYVFDEILTLLLQMFEDGQKLKALVNTIPKKLLGSKLSIYPSMIGLEIRTLSMLIDIRVAFQRQISFFKNVLQYSIISFLL